MYVTTFSALPQLLASPGPIDTITPMTGDTPSKEPTLHPPRVAAQDTLLAGILQIDQAKLLELAASLAASPMEVPNWSLPVYPQADDAFVQFIGVQNALNFCFFNPEFGAKFAIDYQDRLWGGATGLCAALMRALESGTDVLDHEVLSKLTIKDAEQIFLSAAAPLPLLAERVAMLNSLSASLAPYDGLFANVIRASNYNAPGVINKLVTEFPAYGTDRFLLPRTHEPLVFDKRARLFAIIYAGRAHSSTTLPQLSNVAAIGPAVDYQLPRYLRDRGVLIYGPALAQKVDSQTLIAPGSDEELVLRTATDEVCRQLVTEINALAPVPITMLELDFAMWVGGRAAGGNHHLTLTTAY